MSWFQSWFQSWKESWYGPTAAPPVAEDGILSTTKNHAANGTLVATDPQSIALGYALVDVSSAHGTVLITNSGTGAYTYTPTTGYTGPASFTFLASQRGAGSGWTLSDTTAYAYPGIGAMAISPVDGKIYLAGGGDTTGWVIARYLGNGSLDTSWGSSGWLLSNIAGSISPQIQSLRVQTDGKLLVGNYSEGGALIVRFNVDGTPDSGFGTAGKIVFDSNSSSGVGTQMAVDSSGNIYVAFYTAAPVAKVAKLNSAGVLDGSFGTGGIATFAGLTGLYVYGLALQSDGKIVIGYVPAIVGNQAYVARFNANGTADTGFGTGGVSTFTVDAAATLIEMYSLAIQSDGKIVGCGYVKIANVFKAFAFRLSGVDGSLDSGYGTGGVKVVTVAESNLTADHGGVFYGVAMQSDDKAVFNFCSNLANGLNGVVNGFARLSAVDGSLIDYAFVDVRVETVSAQDHFGVGMDVAVDSQGRILVAEGDGNLGLHWEIARFTSAGVLDDTFGTNLGGLDSNVATISITVTASVGGLLVRRRRMVAA